MRQEACAAACHSVPKKLPPKKKEACLERVSHLLPLPELQDTLLDERIRDSISPIARLFANLVGAQREHGASLLRRPRKCQTHKRAEA
jgi:hypothetical protein